MSDLIQSHIEPCHEEVEHPFVMVPRTLIRDPNISPECKWFISYLLSHSGRWRVSIPYVIRTQKISKNRIYPIIKEAMEAGYLKREEYLDKGKKRYKYIISREPKFKINLLCPQNQDTVKQDTENEDGKEYKPSFKEGREEQHEVGRTSSPPSAEAESLCEFFLNKIKERSPNFKTPNLVKWKSCFDLLLRIDKRNPQEVRNLIEWASTHKFWKAGCLSAEKLRDKYDEMIIQMNAEGEKSLVQTNRTYALKLKEKYPDQMKAMSFDDKFVINYSTAQEVPFNLPSQQFKQVLISMFGGEYVAKGG